MGLEELTQAERFFSRTPPGGEYLPLVLLGLIVVMLVVTRYGQGRR